MAKRFTIMLVALLALGFVIAGCGDDDDDSASDNTTTAEQATSEDTATESESEGDAASGVPATPQAKQAVEQCKSQADANPQLSDRAKDKIGEVCEEAGSGDADGAVKATREACEIIVEDTAPSGSAKQTALQACKQSTTTP
jgi:hypothetical protein